MITIESVTYEPVDSILLPGKALRVIVTGSGLEPRGQPIRAVVGPQPVLNLMPLLSETPGVQGFLASEPATGDELRIGYADQEMINTGFKYDPNVA